MNVREAHTTDEGTLKAMQSKMEFGEGVVFRREILGSFFARAQAHEAWSVFVAEDGDEIAGSAACSIRDGVVGGRTRRIGYQFQLFVAPEYRRRGVASALAEHRERYLRDEGAELIYLVTEKENEAARRVAEKRGFLLCAELVNCGRIAMPLDGATEAAGGIRPYREADAPAIARLLAHTWANADLAPPFDEAFVAGFLRRVPGTGASGCFVLEEAGEPAACLALGDRSGNEVMVTVSVSEAMRGAGPWVPKPGDKLPPAFPVGLVGYRDPEQLRRLLRHVNDQLLGRPSAYYFFVHEAGKSPVAKEEGFFQVQSSAVLYCKPLSAGVELDGTRWYVDPLESY